jgi:hypothetical protein
MLYRILWLPVCLLVVWLQITCGVFETVMVLPKGGWFFQLAVDVAIFSIWLPFSRESIVTRLMATGLLIILAQMYQVNTVGLGQFQALKQTALISVAPFTGAGFFWIKEYIQAKHQERLVRRRQHLTLLINENYSPNKSAPTARLR